MRIWWAGVLSLVWAGPTGAPGDYLRAARDMAFDPSRLPFASFPFGNDGQNEREIEFTASRKRFGCDTAGYRSMVSDTLPSEVPFVLSPDKKWSAFISKPNAWVRPRRGKDSTQLTTAGVEHWGYGLTTPRPTQPWATAPVL